MNRYVIVVGSSRLNSNSRRLADVISICLDGVDPGSEIQIIDLARLKIPMWDEEFWEPTKSWVDIWSPISQGLSSATAFIFVVPEWAGMVPPELKNFLLLCEPEEVGHKPALIATLSTGRGGSYPVVEFRMNGTKNNRLLLLPEHLIFHQVESFLGSNERSSLYMHQRLEWCLQLLRNYSVSMVEFRRLSSSLIVNPMYEHGM